MKNKVTIGVFGHYGNENLGDEAIIEAVIQNFKRRIPDLNIVCFSVNPEDTARRYQLTTFPIRKNVGRKMTHADEVKQLVQEEQSKDHSTVDTTHAHQATDSGIKALIKKIPLLWPVLKSLSQFSVQFKELPSELAFLKQSKQNLKEVDLLVIAGSNQFLDNFGGCWGFPYTLLKWSVLARLSGTKLAYMSVGAGPLEAKLSRLMSRIALLFAHYNSYRDIASKSLIENGGWQRKGLIYPDLAQSLDMTKVQHHQVHDVEKKPRVGINLMPIYDSRYWCDTDHSKYKKYISKIAEFAKRLMDEDYPLFFYATQPKDELALNDAVNALKQSGVAIRNECDLIKHCYTVYELMDLLANADILVPTRFHGVVLSLLSGKPTLGICYHRKSADLLKEMGQEQYAVDLNDFKSGDLYEKFKLLEENYSLEQQKIKRQSDEHGKSLAEQYDFVVNKFIKR